MIMLSTDGAVGFVKTLAVDGRYWEPELDLLADVVRLEWC
jgi:hypothetical protein